MCLAVPGKVVEVDREGFGVSAEVDIFGITRKIVLDLVPTAEPGDWVLVHAGTAIEVIDEQYASETIEILRSVPYLEADINIFGDAPEELRANLSGSGAGAGAPNGAVDSPSPAATADGE